MSLLNAWVQPSEAVLAVDVLGARVDGSLFPSSKLLPVPHLGCALAVRGQAALLQGLFLRAAGAGFATFDEINEAMLAVLEDLIESMPPRLLVEAPHVSSGNIVVLAGWSDARGGVVGRKFVQRAAGEPFTAADFTTLLTPWPPALQHLPTTARESEEIARAQCGWMRATYPGAACGGKLVLCRLTRAGVEMVRKPLDVEVMA